ncbi:MAG: thioredoxin [Microcoleus sp. PH2017_01_SCD_O_A]|uniref:thioredoxin family protein n=1 Tax=unclassified Microcoleus TaxID=2642155 RepID=UPI001D6BCBF1|nr:MULTISPECIES: thioredoxin domain-containing protein [unclassified Microcoleus]MCC3444665.1 thioredoxin [Microcoleus sp. PH2017_03_ELD_O_A]MCC3465312.1 thioredoxin [Microcoleus sp. PH2017_06_SFM_O_A]MCC3506365.1 thioredoxin [Microcoleus sp. PH2017_19_SFW_U_A]TAF88873.1 MAG: thioredoxin [Oscillatoriales cyanobacterium]MCC3426576.1 thioredoxin [Microcoleus sp. PH2017_01_SCD_O_A]
MVLSVSERTFAQEVFQASTPVLVHFWAPWCGLCRAIDPTLTSFEAQWAGKVKLLGVNADQSLKLANTYRLSSLPTLILFEGDRVLFRFENYQGREELRRTLDSWMLATQNSSQTQRLQPQEALNR